jgi:diacylglycerol kinase family enzyme
VIVPLGTENLLAKEFGFTTDPADICQTVTENQVWRMDAGDANGKLFLIMATAGFDAEVTRVLAEVRKGHIRHWSYAKPIVSVVRSYSYPPIRVRGANPVRGTDQEVEAAWAMAFNVPRYALGIPFCPRAVVDDGELDFCLLHRPGLVAGLGYLLKILLRRSGSVSRTTTGRSAELHWESPTTTPIPYQLDGDFVGYLPVSLRVRKERVTMLRPTPRSRVGLVLGPAPRSRNGQVLGATPRSRVGLVLGPTPRSRVGLVLGSVAIPARSASKGRPAETLCDSAGSRGATSPQTTEE